MNRILINGIENTQLDVRDRGFQYGDGLFETIAYKNGQLQFWQAHLRRLQEGCERLSLNQVDEQLWLDDIKQCQLKNDAVIKLSVTRGVSGRGYAYANNDPITRVLACSAWPDYPAENQQGITAINCNTPISINSALAGIKHLNRLDNVLARNEWQDKTIAEGFMFDNNEYVIEGTMSNVFCVMGDELYTPLLERCGVAGIMRQRIIDIAADLNIGVNIVDINKQNFMQMDAIFVTNSLIEIWPVKKIDAVSFSSNALISKLKTELKDI